MKGSWRKSGESEENEQGAEERKQTKEGGASEGTLRRWRSGLGEEREERGFKFHFAATGLISRCL